jgi:Ca-activated chloride channel family protein
VRIEEMLNYFHYNYAPPAEDGDTPFAFHTALAPCPWKNGDWLMRVALKGKVVPKNEIPPANLVFLIDVSGSMDEPDKLPLLQASMNALVSQLRPQDRISIVTYANGTNVVLEGVSGQDKNRIEKAIDALTAGGGTAGGAGIELAYRQAENNFIRGGINRILLATDGDFNVGISDVDSLKKMVEEKRKSGVSLSTLGFGTGNYNEPMMEDLADAGNGNYAYIDSMQEGRKALVKQFSGTLDTIAKDVKIQIEFNPAQIHSYRLIGYEDRALKREDFNNDKVDAGEIGSGHAVTALYELTPEKHGSVDPLRYQNKWNATRYERNSEIAYIKLRYKNPNGTRSILLQEPIERSELKSWKRADSDFRFAAAVAGFGQLLRNSPYAQWNYDSVEKFAKTAKGDDADGYRAEFLRLVESAKSLTRQEAGANADADE